MEEKKNVNMLVIVLIAIIVILLSIIVVGIWGRQTKTEISKVDSQSGLNLVTEKTEVEKIDDKGILNLFKRLEKIDGSYISLENITSEDDAKYNVNATIYETMLIDKSQYDNMVNSKKILLDNIEYLYFSDSDTKYGYIKKDNIRYDVLTTDNGYMFLLYGSAGRGVRYTKQEEVMIELNENVEVYDNFTGETHLLNESKNLIEEKLKEGALIFIEEDNNNIYIYIDSK